MTNYTKDGHRADSKEKNNKKVIIIMTAIILIAVFAAITISVGIGAFIYIKTKAVTEKTAAGIKTADNKKINAAIEKLKAETSADVLELDAQRAKTDVYDSKLGGIPYLPPGFDYPHNKAPKSDGKPLKLLAQLNFSKLPHIADFPEKGILQVYVAYEEKEDCYGVNFDNPCEQQSFRIIYHENIVDDRSQLGQPPKFTDGNLPFEGEFLLKAAKTKCAMAPDDFRFNDLFMKDFDGDANIKSYYDLDDDTIDFIHESLSSSGHRIGGYPFFTQEDPRGYADSFKNHTVLLLQIDSIGEIMWGDCGVANFFITPEDLKKCDFSNVIYTWDCY